MTLYTVGTIKEIPGIRSYVAVDGGMSDNPRPVLYGSGYETFLPRSVKAERSLKVRVVGKHCESGDVLVRDGVVPDDLKVGDVLATPVTGAYGHSMGSNYNKVPRPAVVFVGDGEARLVVARESYARPDPQRPMISRAQPRRPRLAGDALRGVQRSGRSQLTTNPGFGPRCLPCSQTMPSGSSTSSGSRPTDTRWSPGVTRSSRAAGMPCSMRSTSAPEEKAYGGAAFEEILEDLRQRGLTRVFLETERANTRVRAFYAPPRFHRRRLDLDVARI